MCFEGAVEAAISGLFRCQKTLPGTIVAPRMQAQDKQQRAPQLKEIE